MATEDRWHDFAKEKPSEDMEGRDFIVSNGYSDTLSMWCGGYWENEPFMGNKLCDEVVRWKGYLTPEEEKANEATRTELKAYSVVASSETENYINGETNLAFEAYDADDVDALLAEKDEEIDKQKWRGDEWAKACNQKDKEIARQNTEIIEAVKTMKSQEDEIVQLKQKLEDVQASAYAESVDAGMANKKLQDELTKLKAQMPKYKEFIEDEDYRKKLVDEYAGYVYEWAGHRYVATPYINVFIKGILRTLYKALANWAKSERYTEATWYGDEHREELWAGVEERCRAKAEEYK